MVVTQSRKGQLTDQTAQAYKIIQITKGPVKIHNQQAAQVPSLRNSQAGVAHWFLPINHWRIRGSGLIKTKTKKERILFFREMWTLTYFFCSGGRSGLILNLKSVKYNTMSRDQLVMRLSQTTSPPELADKIAVIVSVRCFTSLEASSFDLKYFNKIPFKLRSVS